MRAFGGATAFMTAFGTADSLLAWVGIHYRGVQWMGAVLHNKLVHNSIQITTPCFHCNPL